MSNPSCARRGRVHKNLRLVLVLTVAGAVARSIAHAQVFIPSQAMQPQQRAAQAPPRAEVEAIGLTEAVQLTLTHDPRIQMARQDVAGAMGLARRTRGAFDSIFAFQPSYTETTHENFPFIATLERQKRQVLRDLSIVFTDAAERLREQLENFDLTAPPCPEGSDIADLLQDDPLQREARARQTGLLPENIFINLGGVQQDIDAALRLCDPSGTAGLSFDSILTIVGGIDGTGEYDLSELLTNAEQLQRERLALIQNTYDLVGTRSGLAYERLGETPEDETTKAYAFETTFFKPLRTGMQWSLSLRLASSERNFDDKPLDPAFGGWGIPDRFPSFLSTSLDIPLGKGKAPSVQAPEIAAQHNLRGQREFLRHVMSGEAVSTILAYLDLAAAQSTLAVLEESSERHRRLVEITRDLVAAGDAAELDIARANARLATVLGAVATAERRVLAARLVLAGAVGLGVDAIGDAPLAADPLSTEFAPIPPVGVLMDRAIQDRRDYRGRGYLRDASETLALGARADLKHRVDFFVSGGVSTLYESPLFRYLPDELETLPKDDAVRYNDPEGYWRSVSGSWDPFVLAGLRMEFPLKNNAAKGRYAQELATLRRSEIEYTETERVIRNNVVSETVAIDRARRQVERRQSAIQNLNETLHATLGLFNDGEVSLIDTLTTEESLTSEELQLIRGLQVYHSLVARLRFETGSVLEFTEEGTIQERARFDAQPFARPFE